MNHPFSRVIRELAGEGIETVIASGAHSIPQRGDGRHDEVVRRGLERQTPARGCRCVLLGFADDHHRGMAIAQDARRRRPDPVTYNDVGVLLETSTVSDKRTSALGGL